MQASDSNPGQDPASLAGATNISLGRSGPAVVLTAQGEFDTVTTPQLRTTIRQAVDDAPEVLVIDLTAVEFFGSGAIAALVDAHLRAADQTSLRIAVEPYLDRMLKLVGLDQQLATYSSLEAALAARGR
ncbi:STAS domain-containing protein [Amycolatopsis sp. DSM 110486]|uniref:STAS domain-containing protein n=1 Tax=Amycolatopsis sp. DSM 110486 TaxID=2865832 RepID=UPI001C69D284|nr:STAS domain-containing protein [Amycolatopsis sp. DSM 110486]QYN19244.1 STAS domain-containing protein [Amycolatopsis sp. DSM 110486]